MTGAAVRPVRRQFMNNSGLQIEQVEKFITIMLDIFYNIGIMIASILTGNLYMAAAEIPLAGHSVNR